MAGAVAMSGRAVSQRVSDFHQRLTPAPRAQATNPTSPKRFTALITAGWGSSANGLAQIPWISSGCSLRESGSAPTLAPAVSLAAAPSLPGGSPIGSSSTKSSATDRSTTDFLVRVTASYAYDVANLKGRRINTAFRNALSRFVQLQCWCLLQFTVEEEWVRATCVKWLETSYLVHTVAICRQFSIYSFRAPAPLPRELSRCCWRSVGVACVVSVKKLTPCGRGCAASFRRCSGSTPAGVSAMG
jgi:hypothetical protein